MNKILIIEDDQIVANIYRNKLTVDGYQVELAYDGETGLQTIPNFQPSAIILDLMLPKMKGVEVLKAIRTMPDFQTVPVIVFSNTYLTNLVQDAWKAGATKCLSKASCSPKQVIDAVRNSLQPPKGARTSAAASSPAASIGAAQATAAAPATERPGDVDAEFQADLRRELIGSLPATLTALRTHLKALIKADGETVRLKLVHELYRKIHALTGNAGIAGLLQIAQMSDALEALLKELYEKPANINASTLRTVALSIDFLAYLFEHGTLPDRQEIPPANILVVDDEAISRRAVTYSLEKAKLKSVTVEDPQTALRLLTENKFDLVFLDVDMPEMNGFELCTRLRNLPAHRKTPVVFVTSLTDFESRASSTMSGGNDFIAKPFLFIELAVKALIYVLRGKLEAARSGADADRAGA